MRFCREGGRTPWARGHGRYFEQAGATERCVAAREKCSALGWSVPVKRTSSARRLLLPLVPAYRLGLALRERGLAAGLSRAAAALSGGQHRQPFSGRLGKNSAGHCAGAGSDAARRAVDVLSRGYGRKSRAALRVDPNGSAEEFGDEPLLIAREAACLCMWRRNGTTQDRWPRPRRRIRAGTRGPSAGRWLSASSA